jgi:hypothetical protein
LPFKEKIFPLLAPEWLISVAFFFSMIFFSVEKVKRAIGRLLDGEISSTIALISLGQMVSD